jgi:cell wall-associated NlpC family hydrolase
MIQPQQGMLSPMSLTVSKPRLAPFPALLGIAALLAGCAGAPSQPSAQAPSRIVIEPRVADPEVGVAIAELARDLVGARYHYGGARPDEGFDCSGLVYYTYGQAGYRVPRTSQELFRAAHKISLDSAAAGDLMFFQDEAKLAHVGIYLGDGRFVHAPAAGQNVTVASLDSPYYQQHLVAVGRLLPR